MRKLVWMLFPVMPIVLVGCAGHRDNTGTASGASGSLTPTLPTPAAYVIVNVQDASFAGRSRASLRVVIKDQKATMQQVHAALLDAAKKQPTAETVMVFGYWPGDDTLSTYTAGRLEWGRDGEGWAREDRVPADGRFDAGQTRAKPTVSPAQQTSSNRQLAADYGGVQQLYDDIWRCADEYDRMCRHPEGYDEASFNAVKARGQRLRNKARAEASRLEQSAAKRESRAYKALAKWAAAQADWLGISFTEGDARRHGSEQKLDDAISRFAPIRQRMVDAREEAENAVASESGTDTSELGR